MDVFKLAFETIIVGLLAFLWLGIAIDLLFPAFFARIVPACMEKNETLMGVGLLSLAYCLGSAILPISSQLLNDEHWPLPEDAIRCWVFMEEDKRLVNTIDHTESLKHFEPLKDLSDCHCSYWDIFFPEVPGKGERTLTFPSSWHDFRNSVRKVDDEKKREKILTLFRLRESKILGQGSDKTELFRQLRERITVLRGAVFSGFVLFLICLFGCIAPVQGQPFNWKGTLSGTILALCFTVFSLYNGYQDLKNPNIFDMPVLEGLLGVITIFGGYLVVSGVKARPFLKKRFLLLAGFFAALAYGGWMWSEVLYDQQVITSYAVLEPGGETGKH